MKRWLRVNGQVEFIPDGGLYEGPGHRRGRPDRRSVMRELLTSEQAAEFEIEPGLWLLPGTPP